jgi:hypothetical protein
MSSKTVKETLAEIGPNDIIKVSWCDASITINTRGKVDNQIIATYKWNIGYYWDVIPDKLYGVPHLVLVSLESHPDNPTVISIPVSVITKIELIGPNERIKSLSCVGMPFLTGKYVKIAARGDGIGERR